MFILLLAVHRPAAYNRRVHVAWDLQAVTGPRPTGLGYAVQLLLEAYRRHGGPAGSPAEVVELRPNAQDRALRGVPDRLVWEQWNLPRAVARKHNVDLLYCPALGAPLRCAIPRVAHVHDLIPLADPAQFSGVARWYWTRLLPACWKRCAAITVSNASLVEEVAQRLSYPRERIYTVPYYATLPPDLHSLEPLLTPPAEPYFLTVGSNEPRKNIELVLQALAVIPAAQRSRLVCIGVTTPHTGQLRSLAVKLGVESQVEWRNYVPRLDLLFLLLKATALLFVSRLEGYGMPPQEAQALGTPVVLSDIACHRAVYDDPQRWQQVEAALREPPPFVAVDDAAALATQMQRLLDERTWRERLIAAGAAYQRTFSAQATGHALAAAFVAALG